MHMGGPTGEAPSGVAEQWGVYSRRDREELEQVLRRSFPAEYQEYLQRYYQGGSGGATEPAPATPPAPGE